MHAKDKDNRCEHDYRCACGEWERWPFPSSHKPDRPARSKRRCVQNTQQSAVDRQSERERKKSNRVRDMNKTDFNTWNECESHLLCIISNHRCPLNEWISFVVVFFFIVNTCVFIGLFSATTHSLAQRINIVWFWVLRNGFTSVKLHVPSKFTLKWDINFRLHPASVCNLSDLKLYHTKSELKDTQRHSKARGKRIEK